MVIECKKPLSNMLDASDLYGEGCQLNDKNETEILSLNEPDRVLIPESNEDNISNEGKTFKLKKILEKVLLFQIKSFKRNESLIAINYT